MTIDRKGNLSQEMKKIIEGGESIHFVLLVLGHASPKKGQVESNVYGIVQSIKNSVLKRSAYIFLERHQLK